MSASLSRAFLPLFLWRIRSIRAQLPPWEAQTFDFGWGPYNSTLTACRSLHISWTTRSGATPTPTASYGVIIYREGDSPIVYNAGPGPSYDWEVNVPVGGPYMLAMDSAEGGTGGVSLVFNVVADPLGATCSSSGLTAGTLDFTMGGSTNQCGTVSITAKGGTPPFTLTVVPEVYPPKVIHYDSPTFDYVLGLSSGVNTFFALQDVNGKSMVSQMFAVGSSSDTSCLKAATTVNPEAAALSTVYPGISISSTTETGLVASGSGSASSSNTAGSNPAGGNPNSDFIGSSHRKHTVGVIVGPVIAGIAIIAILLWRCRRRQSGRRAEVELTPTRSPVELPMVYGDLVAEPYSALAAQAGAQMSDADQHRLSMASSKFSSANSSEPFDTSPHTSIHQSYPGAPQFDPYGSYNGRQVAAQPRRSSSPLPPGAAAPNPMAMMSNQMQSFGVLYPGPDFKPPQTPSQQLQGSQGGTSSASGTLDGDENPASSSTSGLQLPPKGLDDRMDNHGSPPPVYTER
ncbi:hypothetical protein FRB95_003001 [Tulasnella sp. JGI-2019a]|nr:hypothetical protein FRB95_003001 [Tulasnella sp. JGI-2019a]